MSEIQEKPVMEIVEKPTEQTTEVDLTPQTEEKSLPKNFSWKPESEVVIKGAELGILNSYINTVAIPNVKFTIHEFYNQDEGILLATQAVEVLNLIFRRMQDAGLIEERIEKKK